MWFFFGVDRVGMQVKDCIACTPVLLGPALQYIVHIKLGQTAFFCWVERVSLARVYSARGCVLTFPQLFECISLFAQFL